MRYILVLLLLTQCNYERVYLSEIDELLQKKRLANEEIIREAEKRESRYKYEGDYYGIKLMKATHADFKAFIDSIDSFKEGELYYKIAAFQERTRKYTVDYPSEYLIDKKTKPSLAKLLLAEIENVQLRASLGHFCTEYNRIMVAVFPSKNVFRRGEKITGDIICYSYYAASGENAVKLNGIGLPLTEGKASFSIDPKVSTSDDTPFTLSAQFSLGDTTLYSKTEVLIRGN